MHEARTTVTELTRRMHELELELRRLENEREELTAAYKEAEAVSFMSPLDYLNKTLTRTPFNRAAKLKNNVPNVWSQSSEYTVTKLSAVLPKRMKKLKLFGKYTLVIQTWESLIETIFYTCLNLSSTHPNILCFYHKICTDTLQTKIQNNRYAKISFVHLHFL